MHLAEEMLLLLIRRAAGTLPSRPGVHAALAAAVLAELIEDGEAEIADGWATVRDGHPLQAHLSGTGLYRTMLDRLTEQGALVRRRRWWTLGVVSTTVWRVADRDALHAELSATLAGDTAPTTRTGTLIALSDALGAIRTLFTKHDLDRAAEIAQATWPVCELAGAVAKAAEARPEYSPGGSTYTDETD